VDDPPVKGVLTVSEGIRGGDVVLDDPGLLVVGGPVMVEHVGQPLVGVAGDLRIVVQLLEVPLERPRPAEVRRDRASVLLAEFFEGFHIGHSITGARSRPTRCPGCVGTRTRPPHRGDPTLPNDVTTWD